MDLKGIQFLSDLRYYIMRNAMTHTSYQVLLGKPNKQGMIRWTAITKVQRKEQIGIQNGWDTQASGL